jgi:hypothetical protein
MRAPLVVRCRSCLHQVVRDATLVPLEVAIVGFVLAEGARTGHDDGKWRCSILV